MADPAFRDNPWSAEFWNLTAQGAYVKKYGEDMARKKARDAGSKFGATRAGSIAMPRANFTVIVQRRDIVSNNGATSAPIPRGYAGVGPPDEFVADNA